MLKDIIKKIGWSVGVLETHSLPELLAEKKWTDACGLTETQVLASFKILRDCGEKTCIHSIKQNMK